MSLDLTKVAPELLGMVGRLSSERAGRKARLNSALETLHKVNDISALQKKIEQSKTDWPVAGLVELPDHHYLAPPAPTDFNVIATDGSHIGVDRHQPARCYLINIGSVVLKYGSNPDAELGSLPFFYASDADLVITQPGGRHQLAVEGAILGARRAVAECQHLAELAAALPESAPALALLDGSLVLWGLESYPDFVSDELLEKGLLVHLDSMRKLAKTRKLAVASHISFSRSSDVSNILRLQLCPHPAADCDRFCAANAETDCGQISGISDRELFWETLAEGERSALFMNRAQVVRQHYAEHRVYFFYLKADEEIARVEVPQWVAADKDLLDLTHSLVIDQCRRGHGYPVALSEAHEQAVVTVADRENFWQLVQSLLVDDHLETPGSRKNFTKQTRWV
jgi:hypothetical protein